VGRFLARIAEGMVEGLGEPEAEACHHAAGGAEGFHGAPGGLSQPGSNGALGKPVEAPIMHRV
jgi:hypothetical protein